MSLSELDIDAYEASRVVAETAARVGQTKGELCALKTVFSDPVSDKFEIS